MDLLLWVEYDSSDLKPRPSSSLSRFRDQTAETESLIAFGTTTVWEEDDEDRDRAATVTVVAIKEFCVVVYSGGEGFRGKGSLANLDLMWPPLAFPLFKHLL